MKKLLLLLLLIPNLVMAETYELEHPNGTTYSIESREGLSDEQVWRAVERHRINKAFKPQKTPKAVSDCFISVAKSAKTKLASGIGTRGCWLKHSNSFFSSKRQRGKCLISIAKSAKTKSAAGLGARGCNSKYRD